jgi:hypothetical protein
VNVDRSGAVCLGASLAMVVYAGFRAEQVLFHPAVDQATVLFTEHSGYSWRALMSSFAGALAASCWAMASVAPRTTARLCVGAIALATTSLLVQATFAP